MGRKGKNRRRQQTQESSPAKVTEEPEEASISVSKCLETTGTPKTEPGPRSSKIPILSAKARLGPITPFNTAGSRIPRLSVLSNSTAIENRKDVEATEKFLDNDNLIPSEARSVAFLSVTTVRGQA